MKGNEKKNAKPAAAVAIAVTTNAAAAPRTLLRHGLKSIIHITTNHKSHKECTNHKSQITNHTNNAQNPHTIKLGAFDGGFPIFICVVIFQIHKIHKLHKTQQTRSIRRRIRRWISYFHLCSDISNEQNTQNTQNTLNSEHLMVDFLFSFVLSRFKWTKYTKYTKYTKLGAFDGGLPIFICVVTLQIHKIHKIQRHN